MLNLVSSQPRGEPVTLSPPPTPLPLVVHVSGAVAEPGVYTLPPGSRVKDAIESAGGASQDASIQGLNLAAPLQDGDLIWIPAIPKANPTSSETDKTPGKDQAPISTPASSGLININTATLEELDTLPGIGPVKAQSIIDHRNDHGPFKSIEAIQDVAGIGPATFDGLRDLITVQTFP